MPEPRDIIPEQPALPICWLCGNPVAAIQADQLIIDDAYQVLHRDCSEQVKKSADV